MSDQTLPNLRKDYERGEFDESMAAPAPLDQFRQWLDEVHDLHFHLNGHNFAEAEIGRAHV